MYSDNNMAMEQLVPLVELIVLMPIWVQSTRPRLGCDFDLVTFDLGIGSKEGKS